MKLFPPPLTEEFLAELFPNPITSRDVEVLKFAIQETQLLLDRELFHVENGISPNDTPVIKHYKNNINQMKRLLEKNNVSS